MAEDAKSKSWWSTIPSIVKEIAGLIVAISGLLLALNQLGFFKDTDPTPPTPPPSPSSDIVERDGKYVVYASGVVKDTENGLEWKPGPDKDTDWNKANYWVEGLTLDGGGWRMPTLDELSALYKEGAGDHNMTPLLKTTGSWVWSDKKKGSSQAWVVHFDYVFTNPADCKYDEGGRAFAVRCKSDR